MAEKTLRTLCISYVHSIRTCDIILEGNSFYSNNDSKIQKRIFKLLLSPDTETLIDSCLKNQKFYPCSYNIYIYIYIFIIVCGEE